MSGLGVGEELAVDCRSGCCSFRGLAGGSVGCSGGLVVAVGVEDELAEEFSGGGVDDPDLEVLDEQDDVSLVASW